MDTQNKPNKIICHDCRGNGYIKDCYDEVHQCKNCKSQGEVVYDGKDIFEFSDSELESLQ
jgi:DnaJ-class molecular chaperone